MKYIDEYRNNEKVKIVADLIHKETLAARSYRFMEFCGGHTHAIYRYGLQDLLPKNIDLIHGPGCPVCVLPVPKIDAAIKLASEKGVILCTFGDMLRVPASKGTSLLSARAEGNDIRMVYSPLDSLKIAEENPEMKTIFFAVGFETTAPTTASLLKRAGEARVKNFQVFCNHILTTPAIELILSGAESPETPEELRPRIDGFIGPGHVSTVLGADAYQNIVKKYHRPIVVTGFEPLDIINSILMLVRQRNKILNGGRAAVENEYSRSATFPGNQKAKTMMDEVFVIRDFYELRGIGRVPNCALKIRDEFKEYDAEVSYDLSSIKSDLDERGCLCGLILRGVKKPADCPLFGRACTPDHPIGACMVSSEGACAARYLYHGEDN